MNATRLYLCSFILYIGLSAAQLDPNAVVIPSIGREPEDRFTYGETNGNQYGPAEWHKIKCADVRTCPGWPTPWHEKNPEIAWNEMENRCYHCTNTTEPSQCRRTRNSPIPLDRNITLTEECRDRHRMYYRAGTCRFGSLRFEILPHTLRVHQPAEPCTEMPNIDYSLGFPDPWYLSFTDISVPSHHVLDGVRYDAEVVLSHVWSISNRTDRLIGNVSILLEKGNETDRYDFLDLYIKKFEAAAAMSHRRCKLKLTTMTGRTGSETSFVNDNDMDDAVRNLNQILPRHKQQAIETEYFNRTFNPYDWYLKTGTEYYWRYEGSTVVPPCIQTTHWRVLKDPIKVAPSQILDLERLMAQSRDPATCEYNTVGRRRSSDQVRVDVTRPLQVVSPGHKLVFCECIDWDSRTDNDKAWCQLSPEERGVYVHPTSAPTSMPTVSSAPTVSDAPSVAPSVSNAPSSSSQPSSMPSISSIPSAVPSDIPSASSYPSDVPSNMPTDKYATQQSDPPSDVPSGAPSQTATTLP